MAIRPKVLEYVLHITDIQTLLLPIGAKVLSVQCQRESLVLWALVDPTAELEYVAISIYGTGNTIPNYDSTPNFLGTAQMPSGLVWHVFTNKKREEL